MSVKCHQDDAVLQHGSKCLPVMLQVAHFLSHPVLLLSIFLVLTMRNRRDFDVEATFRMSYIHIFGVFNQDNVIFAM